MMTPIELDGIGAWMTLRAAAKACGLSIDAAKRRVYRCHIPTARLEGRVLVRIDDLRNALRRPVTRKQE